MLTMRRNIVFNTEEYWQMNVKELEFYEEHIPT